MANITLRGRSGGWRRVSATPIRAIATAASLLMRPGAAALLALAITGCGGGESANAPQSAPPAAVAPTITAQPAALAVTEGDGATFSVSASGSTPLAYQWKRGGADIAGATASTYTLAAATLADNGAAFSVSVSNSAGSVTSTAAALTVNARLVPASITSSPQSVTVAELQTVTLTVTASGTAPFTYQWQRSADGATWTDIAGATADSYTTAQLVRTDSGTRYRVIVNNAANQPATSTPAQLTVTADAAVLLATGGTVSGDNNRIRLEVPPGTLLGPTRFTFSPVASLPKLPADYELVPDTAYTIVHEGPGFVPNMPVTVIFRSTIVTTVQAVRTTPETRVSRMALPPGGSAYYVCPDGTDGAIVLLEDIQQGNAKGVLIACVNTPGSNPPSGSTTVGQVRPAASVRPDITQQPVDVALTAPGTATFSVTATGRAPLAYQWQRNGIAIAGANSASYSINAGAADTGARFSVVVSNAFGSMTSREATVVIGDGPLLAGRFATFDTAGNIYVTTSYRSVRKIAPNRQISTLAQLTPYSDGGGAVAPEGVATDPAGNVYVADDGPNVILKISPSGAISTLAGSDRGGVAGCYDAPGQPGSAAYFFGPRGLVLDSNSNVFVADSVCSNVRRITPSGAVSTFVGALNDGFSGYGSVDGTGTDARFNAPQGVAIDSAGNLYVTDTRNHTIRKVTPQGVVSTLAGLAGSFGTADGAGDQARFRNPTGIAVDAAGNLYVTDFDTRVRRITPSGVVSTLAGATASTEILDGTGTAARFRRPHGPFVDAQGNVYVLDDVTLGGQTLIRRITPAGVVSTVF